MCRYGNGNYYAFEIQDTQVTIGKFKNNGFRALGSTNVGGIHVGAANQLTAMCENVGGQRAARLIFIVNGAQVLDVTDRNRPLATGTVGLFAYFYGVSVPNGVEAAFQNFEVRQL